MPDFKVLEDLSVENSDIDSIFQNILNEIKVYLGIDPIYDEVKVLLKEEKTPKNLEIKNIFTIGVNKYNKENIFIIEIFQDYLKFLRFILLREAYNLFIPIELKSYEFVHIVINQIILNDLSKASYLNEWKLLVRKQISNFDLLSSGFNRLITYDRLDQFFKLHIPQKSYTPVQFFFNYIRKNPSFIHNRIEDVHDIFLKEFTNYISASMNNDEIIETIRCIIKIFYNIKNYQSFLSYKKYFQEYKEKGELNTSLSLRRFIKSMDWIKNYSYIAPSYLLNYKTINVCLILVFLRFNPLINKYRVHKIIQHLPFFTTLKVSSNSFAVDISGYMVIPKIFLEDFLGFIKKLENFGYIINHYCLSFNKQTHFVNLNYFKESLQNRVIIDPNNRQYNKKFEIEFQLDYGIQFQEYELSILDFLILDRIRFFSVSGFGFEQKAETLSILKSDLFNEIEIQNSLTSHFIRIARRINQNPNLKAGLLHFLELNKKFGFFFIKKMLEKFIILFNLLEETLFSDLKKNSTVQFKNYFEDQYPSQLIEDNIMLRDVSKNDMFFKGLFPPFFESKEFSKEEFSKYKIYNKFLNICQSLKLFNLNSIKKILVNQKIADSIYKKREKYLHNVYKKYKMYKITNKKINTILDNLLNFQPPVIQPLLINTIRVNYYVNDYLQLIIKDSPNIRKSVEQIKIFFPRALIVNTKDLISNKDLLYIEISTPYLTINEKQQVFTIIYNTFKDNILYGKSYLWSGIVDALSSKSFYDFENYKFFYTKDLYEQYFLYVRSVLGENLEPINHNINKNQAIFWSKRKDIMKLVKKVNTRIKSENYEFNKVDINKLLIFYLSLNRNLLDEEEFIQIKQENFFANSVKSIKFIPAFQYFGLGQYFLYLYPSDINEIDFKLLLINTFQKIKFPACIDNSNSFLIKYVMPYGDPNNAYLNWLVKSKKIIREYCGFFIKKVHHLFQFNYNITSEGWVYSPDRFKAHMQNILFNKDYEFQNPEIKEFNLSDRKEFSHFGPNSPEYESLSNIYNWRPLDIKSYLGTLKYYPTENFTDLIKKDLIFPYLTLKNLDLQDKLYIIIPDLKEELNKTLIDIFSFFNYGFIYETEGEYFIHGFPEEVHFKNGLMIKLYLPDCELSEFIQVFDLLFEYLEINDYLILNDLVDGSNLIESVFRGLKFLDSYNPLKNLIWNETSKVWENHKLFTPKFEPIYPDLIEKEKKD